ncbi:unnamed protein product [Brugia timori]|uniref:Copine domain-containing protein n=1 Tax=Brugia timori TaxID=42155 RepID=A0A0R3QLP4_9BILA|nr:unnamed protein product [Brugia timori]
MKITAAITKTKIVTIAIAELITVMATFRPEKNYSVLLLKRISICLFRFSYLI